ncbi:hypothetical protein CA834_00045 [Winogradskyella aurantia]|uniref:Uncharacterized protein n=1 Tax=Winogradskyella aurantia TaxID=1915063 RepID=A0A265UYZ9_9FLAO|nr:hypothetical protein CA834_00045 [Winogradskyella aurantia]
MYRSTMTANTSVKPLLTSKQVRFWYENEKIINSKTILEKRTSLYSLIIGRQLASHREAYIEEFIRLGIQGPGPNAKYS